MMLLITLLLTLPFMYNKVATSLPVSSSNQEDISSKTIPATKTLNYIIPVVTQKSSGSYYNTPTLQYYQPKAGNNYYQTQPTAMLIIAQPGLVPHQYLYSQIVQQLLNYFHNNPQARYQFLYGGTPHQYANQLNLQQTYPNPTNYYTSNTYQSSYNQQPVKSIPPIITGLEHFSPEQQAQIKEHLNNHLGNGGYTTNSIPQNYNYNQPTQVIQTNQQKYAEQNSNTYAATSVQQQTEENSLHTSQGADNKQDSSVVGNRYTNALYYNKLKNA